jgi:hypothetical protein
VGREQNDFGMRGCFFYLLYQIDAVAVGQKNVAQHYLRGLAADLFQSRSTVGSGRHLISFQTDNPRQQFQYLRLVIYNKYRIHRFPVHNPLKN